MPNPPLFAKYPLKFLLLWIFATFGGFVVSLFWVEIGEQSEIGAISAAVGGLAIALPQSLILRDTIFTLKWILFTPIAWVILTILGVGAVGWIVPNSELLPLRLLYSVTSGIVGGFGIGTAQWLAIRQPKSWAWQWILVNSLTWALAIPIGSTVGFLLHRLTQLFVGEILGLAITWLIVAILTGINAYQLFKGH
ncbi:hypothetical protein [Nostoc sp. TCL26-01]|uniref:hypothetical protein n=1 Tax=Nostoc sp. TCL26-01 TaxID=2576904 RepID=UPI0015B89CA1|nr:hypothetical protein [Nostoc sp. TCL26-01]QLE58602.1 hypothetical protein FD725_25725 [Nostoc sp. TCL26-01]